MLGGHVFLLDRALWFRVAVMRDPAQPIAPSALSDTRAVGRGSASRRFPQRENLEAQTPNVEAQFVKSEAQSQNSDAKARGPAADFPNGSQSYPQGDLSWRTRF